MTYTRVSTNEAVAQLAHGLRDPARVRPWVVVSSPFGQAEPELLVDELLSEVADVARVFLIETGDLTHQLSDLLPERFQVYGGAARSYPAATAAHGDTFAEQNRSKLRFSQGNPQRATELLVTDVLGHAHQSGLFDHRPASALVAAGTVRGFLPGGSRALVEVDGGGLATIWQELTHPPVPLDWTLQQGQRVAGTLDLATRRLNVEAAKPTRASLAQRYPHGSVALALVQKIGPTRALLALHPQVAITVTRPDISPNPLDTVDSLLALGDVVAARVLHLPDGLLQLRLSDVDDHEPVLPPLVLVPGGRPWLVEGRPLLPVVEPVAQMEVVAPVSLQEPSRPAVRADTAPEDLAPPTPVLAQIPVTLVRPPERAVPRPGMARVTAVVIAQFVPSASERDAELLSQRPMAVATPAPAIVLEPLGRPVAGAALLSTQLALSEAKARITRLELQLADAGSLDSQLEHLRELCLSERLQRQEALVELGTAHHELARVEAEQRLQKKLLRDARRATTVVASAYSVRRAQWADVDGWLRHEIYLAWIDRFAPADRVDWPLAAGFVLLDQYAESLAALTDGQLSKALKASVDVLTGRVRSLAGRRLHPLRTGNGASAAELVRADGARCMRVAVEQNAPAARRLHYWILPDGGIELSRVVTHDDMEP